jgi:hypothetical protein
MPGACHIGGAQTRFTTNDYQAKPLLGRLLTPSRSRSKITTYPKVIHPLLLLLEQYQQQQQQQQCQQPQRTPPLANHPSSSSKSRLEAKLLAW